jgi:hypothetical protein
VKQLIKYSQPRLSVCGTWQLTCPSVGRGCPASRFGQHVLNKRRDPRRITAAATPSPLREGNGTQGVSESQEQRFVIRQRAQVVCQVVVGLRVHTVTTIIRLKSGEPLPN